MATPPNGTPAPGMLYPQRLGDYTILSKIGSGGMATVYRAQHVSSGREVALKVLALHLQDRPDFRVRFQREAYMLQQFEHPHILPVYDYGEDGEMVYIAMRLVEGRSLQHVLEAGEALDPEAIGRYAREIASALDYAHARGIIHRDIKPANILLDSDGSVLLADFGVARLAVDDARLSVAGSFVGTAAYASPEQIRGDAVDQRSDIYALAVLTFQLATGRLPFEGTTALAVIKQHLSARPPNPLAYNPALPPKLYDVLSRGMAKIPDDRYPSALAFSRAVDRAFGVQAPPAADTPPENARDNPAESAPPAREIAGLPPDNAREDLISFDELPPTGTVGDPFAGAYEYDARDLFFDDYTDLEPPDDDLSFAAAFGPLGSFDPEEAEPVVIPHPHPASVRVVNGVVRPLIAPPTIERPARPVRSLPVKSQNVSLYVAVAVSVLLLAVVAAGTMIAWRLRNDDEPVTRTTYSDPTLGITFDYPQAWTLQRGLAAVLSPVETATAALSDAPVPVNGPYGDARIVITVQQIDPIVVFGVPPGCRYALAEGPGATFGCMRAAGYATPVFEPFHSQHTWGVILPGTLPPAPASIPVVLLPSGDPPWIAVTIAHWDGYDEARAALRAIAASVR